MEEEEEEERPSGAAFETPGEAAASGAPLDVPATIRRGKDRKRKGDLAGAESAFRAADDAGSAEGAFELAALLDANGDRIGAIAAYRRAAGRGDPEAESALERLARGGPEVSASVHRAVAALPGNVTASALVAELLSLHPEYGAGAGASVPLDPSAGAAAPSEEWLTRVREAVDPLVAPRLHGRLVIAALARRDEPLRRQLVASGFLDALEREIHEPLDALFAGQAPTPGDAFDFVTSAAADLPSTEDTLGFGPLVQALYALLDDRRTALPLAIAVTAPWGAGKSSVMCQLKALLDTPPPDPEPVRTWRTVQFDAWKYERSERLWAALAKAIYEQPQARMGVLQRLWFRLELEYRRRGRWGFLALTLWPLLAGVAAVFVAMAGDLSPGGTVFALVSSVTAVCAGVGRYWGLFSDPFKRAIERHAKRPDYEAQLGFTAEADHDIRTLTRVLAPDDRHALAVFVDDLDRCSSGHVVEVVEAMNQIFNAAQEHQCVFVLGMDRDVVATSINVAYSETVAELKATSNPLGDRFGLEFLAKLVQLSVAIPQPHPGAIKDLLSRITGNAYPAAPEPSEPDVRRVRVGIGNLDETLAGIEDAAARVAAAPSQAPVVQEAVRRERALRLRDSDEVIRAEFAALDHLDRNPRQVKRFHNAFRLQLYVANEDPAVPFDFTGDQLHALARWVALRLRWPTLGDDILRDPTLLTLLETKANEEGNGSLAEDERKRLERRYGRWLSDRDVYAVMLESHATRRASALSVGSFLRVA